MPASAAEMLRSRLEQQQSRHVAQSAATKRRLAEIDKKADLLYADRLAGRIDTERHDKHATELEKERQKLKTQANFLTPVPKGIKKTVSQMIYVCQNAPRLFEKAEIATKNLMLEILLSNLKLKNKKLSFSLNFPSWAGCGNSVCASKTRKSSTW